MAQLVFNDEANYAGLIQECERRLFNGHYGRISSDATLLKDFTVRLNNGLTWYNKLRQKSDTRWQSTDPNYDTYDIFTDDLVDDQFDYRLDNDFTKIHGVSVKDESGNFYRLDPIDRNDFDTTLEDRFQTKGRPKYYDKQGDAIFIYPAPDANQVTTSGGIKAHVQRTASEFSSTDTTKEPGVAPDHDEAVAIYASWEYAEDNEIQKKAQRLQNKVLMWEDDITDYFAKRDVDDKPRLSPSRHRNLTRLR